MVFVTWSACVAFAVLHVLLVLFAVVFSIPCVVLCVVDDPGADAADIFFEVSHDQCRMFRTKAPFCLQIGSNFASNIDVVVSWCHCCFVLALFGSIDMPVLCLVHNAVRME